jgi:hypothetical protein
MSGLATTPSRPAPFEARQPLARLAAIPRHRREMDRRLRPGEQPLEARAAIALRRVSQVLIVSREQVEGHE